MPWIRQNATVAQWLMIKNGIPNNLPANWGFGIEINPCDELQQNHVSRISVRIKARAYSSEKLLAEYYEEEPYLPTINGEL